MVRQGENCVCQSRKRMQKSKDSSQRPLRSHRTMRRIERDCNPQNPHFCGTSTGPLPWLAALSHQGLGACGEPWLTCGYNHCVYLHSCHHIWKMIESSFLSQSSPNCVGGTSQIWRSYLIFGWSEIGRGFKNVL